SISGSMGLSDRSASHRSAAAPAQAGTGLCRAQSMVDAASGFQAGFRASGKSATSTIVPTGMSTAVKVSNEIVSVMSRHAGWRVDEIADTEMRHMRDGL